jgi:hypothetical protein
VEAALASTIEAAAEIDDAIPALVQRILDLRARELALRLTTREHFGDVAGGPLFLTALRSLASYLTATANGLQPDAPISVTKAAGSGAHAIRKVIHGH